MFSGALRDESLTGKSTDERSHESGVLSRRSLLLATSFAGAHRAAVHGRAGRTEPDPASISARQKAAWQPRPLILDDDGDLVYADETQKGPESFLSLRMHDCRKAGVNSLAWCIMWGIAKKGKTSVRYWQTQKQGIPFQKNMPDPTTVVAKFCRQNQIEVFGSIRMNDGHDGFGLPFPQLVYPLKVQHPEMLIGNSSQRGRPTDGLAAAMWSGLNYAHRAVREDRLWWIENTARHYDLQGVDLNFFRMPWCFRLGEEQQNMPLMTDFIRQARMRLDVVSRQRGRPVLLGVRVPGTIAACNQAGFDIETWLRERLVDRLLTGGGYVCYSTPAEELIRLGHRFEVPVYPCINCPASYKLGGDNLRAAASNLWWAGADGIYLWNFQYISAPGALGYGRPAPEQYQLHLPDIADPQKLKYLDKSFAVSRRVWEQYQRASAAAPLPVVLEPQTKAGTQTIPVRIGDDIPAALHSGRLRDIALRVETSGGGKGDVLTAVFNDAPVQVMECGSDNRHQLVLNPHAVKQGVNQLKPGIARRSSVATKQLTVEYVNVDVRYKRG